MTLRIATRQSKLALWQANHVSDLLRRAHPGLSIDLVSVVSTGDRLTAAPINQVGGVGVFTREIQSAVLEGRADLAVHSLKDLPTQPVEGIVLAAVPERGPVWDSLVLPKGHGASEGIEALPAGARVGTGSLRRRAQIRHIRDDLVFLDIRGNVETRLKKLDEGLYDAIVLAEAGLVRLGLEGRISARLAAPAVFPAAGQGALAVECRAGDSNAKALAAAINDSRTRAATSAERQVLFRLRAGCHAPAGVSSEWEGDALKLQGVVLSADGKTRLSSERSAPALQAISLGTQVAEELIRQGAQPLVDGAE